MLKIIYSTETGTAEDVAWKVFDIISESQQQHVNIVNVEDYDISQLPNEDLVVFIISTSGDGEMPSSMKDFWKFLLKRSLTSDSLSKMKCSIFGLGDSSYEKFNAASR